MWRKTNERHDNNSNTGNDREKNMTSSKVMIWDDSNIKLYVVLGWISAALTILVSPFFAIAGVIFGLLMNKEVESSGNTLIITNIVFFLINIVFGITMMFILNAIYG